MSELQRSFAKAKLAGLPFNPPAPPNLLDEEAGDYFDEVDEEADGLKPLPSPNALPEDDSSSASSASSTGTVIPSPSRKLFARGKGTVRLGCHVSNPASIDCFRRLIAGPSPPGTNSRLAPLPWTDFFAQELYLTPHYHASITHHVYLTPPTSKAGPLFIMHHGAGSSGLSFAAVTTHLLRALPDAGVLALDARGHGETIINDPAQTAAHGTLDLSLVALAGDLERAYHATKNQMGWDGDLPLILVGHSLGGAVVAHVAKARRLEAKVLGFAVLDVVEGSAIDALQSMQGYLSTRPRSFASVESCIDWHVRSRTIRNSMSARVSVPALLKPDAPAGEVGDAGEAADGETPQRWTWRTDLAATQPFWENWFVGLSSKFLTARGAKLLLLAGTDRLDKELMIGQMQGKYQLQVFPEAGHFLHEDVPEKTALVLTDFWRRNDGSKLVLPPKVGDLLARGMHV